MRAGEGERASWYANLREEVARSGGTVVRGFKLYRMRVDTALWKDLVWLATAHMVVATVSPSGTTVYTDPNAQVEAELRAGVDVRRREVVALGRHANGGGAVARGAESSYCQESRA